MCFKCKYFHHTSTLILKLTLARSTWSKHAKSTKNKLVFISSKSVFYCPFRLREGKSSNETVCADTKRAERDLNATQTRRTDHLIREWQFCVSTTCASGKRDCLYKAHTRTKARKALILYQNNEATASNSPHSPWRLQNYARALSRSCGLLQLSFCLLFLKKLVLCRERYINLFSIAPREQWACNRNKHEVRNVCQYRSFTIMKTEKARVCANIMRATRCKHTSHTLLPPYSPVLAKRAYNNGVAW